MLVGPTAPVNSGRFFDISEFSHFGCAVNSEGFTPGPKRLALFVEMPSPTNWDNWWFSITCPFYSKFLKVSWLSFCCFSTNSFVWNPLRGRTLRTLQSGVVLELFSPNDHSHLRTDAFFTCWYRCHSRPVRQPSHLYFLEVYKG